MINNVVINSNDEQGAQCQLYNEHVYIQGKRNLVLGVSKHIGGIWQRFKLVMCVSWGLAPAKELSELYYEILL